MRITWARNAWVRNTWVVGLISICGPLVVACVGQDDASKYREPLPAQGSVALSLPRAGASSTGTRTRNIPDNGSPTSVSSNAEFYAFSRNLTDAIDVNTGAILGAIWAVAQTPPSKVESNKATWGPGQGTALDPIVWRLVVTEVAANEYDYVLEGRPKASTNDADFKSILDGHGYGTAHALHDTGTFTAHNDVFRALDPARSKDRGNTKFVYDVRQFPKTIGVEVRPNDGTGAQWDAKVEHLAQGAGVLSVDAHADIENELQKDGKLESVKLKSQWTTAGAGRADITLAGGSLPIPSVGIVECWDTSFARAFYQDTVTYKPTEGAEAACPKF